MTENTITYNSKFKNKVKELATEEKVKDYVLYELYKIYNAVPKPLYIDLVYSELDLPYYKGTTVSRKTKQIKADPNIHFTDKQYTNYSVLTKCNQLDGNNIVENYCLFMDSFTAFSNREKYTILDFEQLYKEILGLRANKEIEGNVFYYSEDVRYTKITASHMIRQLYGTNITIDKTIKDIYNELLALNPTLELGYPSLAHTLKRLGIEARRTRINAEDNSENTSTYFDTLKRIQEENKGVKLTDEEYLDKIEEEIGSRPKLSTLQSYKKKLGMVKPRKKSKLSDEPKPKTKLEAALKVLKNVKNKEFTAQEVQKEVSELYGEEVSLATVRKVAYQNNIKFKTKGRKSDTYAITYSYKNEEEQNNTVQEKEEAITKQNTIKQYKEMERKRPDDFYILGQEVARFCNNKPPLQFREIADYINNNTKTTYYSIPIASTVLYNILYSYKIAFITTSEKAKVRSLDELKETNKPNTFYEAVLLAHNNELQDISIIMAKVKNYKVPGIKVVKANVVSALNQLGLDYIVDDLIIRNDLSFLVSLNQIDTEEDNTFTTTLDGSSLSFIDFNTYKLDNTESSFTVQNENNIEEQVYNNIRQSAEVTRCNIDKHITLDEYIDIFNKLLYLANNYRDIIQKEAGLVQIAYHYENDIKHNMSYADNLSDEEKIQLCDKMATIQKYKDFYQQDSQHLNLMTDFLNSVDVNILRNTLSKLKSQQLNISNYHFAPRVDKEMINKYDWCKDSEQQEEITQRNINKKVKDAKRVQGIKNYRVTTTISGLGVGMFKTYTKIIQATTKDEAEQIFKEELENTKKEKNGNFMYSSIAVVKL